MSRGRTVIDCATAEEVGRALYQGYAARCSDEVARQLGAREHQEGVDAFDWDEIQSAIDRPYGDEEPPPPGTEYEYILGLANSRTNPDRSRPATQERPRRRSAARPEQGRPAGLDAGVPAESDK